MNYQKIAACLLIASFLFCVSISGYAENVEAQSTTWVSIAHEAYEMDGPEGSYVLYPVFFAVDPDSMEKYESSVADKINETVQEKAHIPEYVQLLSTVTAGGTGLQMDYSMGVVSEWQNPYELSMGRYLSILFNVTGKMLMGRPSQVYYPFTFDLTTGEEVSFDQLFSDPDGAKNYIESKLEEEVEPLLSTYLENNQLSPVPYDRFFLDGEENIIFLYENSQLSFLSGFSGSVAFRYSELAPWLNVSPDSVVAQTSRIAYQRKYFPDDAMYFLLSLQQDFSLGWLPVHLGDDLEFTLSKYRSTTDSGYYPGGAYYEVEDAVLRGVLILTDENEETVTGLLTSRADFYQIQSGKTTLDEAEAFLNWPPAGQKASAELPDTILNRTPDARLSISADLAEMYRVCPGTASVYTFTDPYGKSLSLTLYADEEKVVQYVKYALN